MRVGEVRGPPGGGGETEEVSEENKQALLIIALISQTDKKARGAGIKEGGMGRR